MFGRLLEKSIVKDNSRNLMFYSDDMHFMGEKPKKVDKLPKCNIRLIADDKYMSYIKVRHPLFLFLSDIVLVGRNSVVAESVISFVLVIRGMIFASR